MGNLIPVTEMKNVQKAPQNTRGTAFRLVSDLTSHVQLKMFRHGPSRYPGCIVHMGKKFQLGYRDVGASSYEPGRLGWLGFQDLASPLFSLQNFRCVDMSRKAGWTGFRDLGFCDRDLGPARFIEVRLITGEAINKKLCDKVPSLTLVIFEPGSSPSILVNREEKPNIHLQKSMLRLNRAAVKKY